MKRAAIYARMSTDKQSDASPEDQIARCRDYAAGQGWHVVESCVVAERGISGASRHNRPGLLGLIERMAEWDVLVCFDSSRLARNGEDLGWLRNRLRVQKRTAVEASTGLDLENVGAKVMGVLNEEYLTKLAHDTHRGLRGRFDRKLATGGCPFGYRTVPIVVGTDGHGHPVTDGFTLEPDAERAAIVVRLFEGYALHGLGLRELAKQMNAERQPSPRGNGWAATAIREMLSNPIYRGERVWNRSEWVKDHETGRRVRHERPESEWVRQSDERWRIVSDELWEATQAVRAKRRDAFLRDEGGRIQRTAIGLGNTRKRLLSGFLRCGECGGSFHALWRGMWGCSWQRNRGTCTNAVRIHESVLEARVLRAVRAALAVEVAEHALQLALDELRKRIEASEPRRLEQDLAALDAKIARTLELASEVGDLAVAKDRLRVLKAEREQLVSELARARVSLPTVEELKPHLREKLAELDAMLRADTARGRLTLGALLGDERLRVYADGRIEGTATLAPGMLSAPRRTPERRAAVVAGAGFEPATCGL